MKWTLIKYAYSASSPLIVEFKTKKAAIEYIQAETGRSIAENLGRGIVLVNEKHLVCKKQDANDVLSSLEGQA